MTKHTSRSIFGTAGLALAGLTLVTLLSGCATSSGDGEGGAGTSTPAASVVGTWGEPAPRQPHLIFDEGSGVSGNDGCNSIASVYAVSGDTVTFSETTSTLMACIGVDSWLSKVSSATINGDTLIVKNEQGDTIGTLTKTA